MSQLWEPPHSNICLYMHAYVLTKQHFIVLAVPYLHIMLNIIRHMNYSTFPIHSAIHALAFITAIGLEIYSIYQGRNI